MSSKFSVSIWIAHPEGPEGISTEPFQIQLSYTSAQNDLSWFLKGPLEWLQEKRVSIPGSHMERALESCHDEFKSWLYHSLALWPQNGYMMTLSINFFIRKMRVTILISEEGNKKQMRWSVKCPAQCLAYSQYLIHVSFLVGEYK